MSRLGDCPRLAACSDGRCACWASPAQAPTHTLPLFTGPATLRAAPLVILLPSTSGILLLPPFTCKSGQECRGHRTGEFQGRGCPWGGGAVSQQQSGVPLCQADPAARRTLKFSSRELADRIKISYLKVLFEEGAPFAVCTWE